MYNVHASVPDKNTIIHVPTLNNDKASFFIMISPKHGSERNF